MEYVRLGDTGTVVSRLCLGCMTYGDPAWRPWILDEQASRSFIRAAVEAGINFFDTADMYSNGVSEMITGQALRDHAPRDEIVVATKVFNPMGSGPNRRGLSRKHILQSIDASLKRLGMDYVDLYIIHRFDYDTPIEEQIEALDHVVQSGKALYIGASSMAAWQFMKMISLQRAMGCASFVSMQNYYNLVYREEEREMLPLCRSEGIATTPWSPLARGFLAGRTGGTPRADNDPYAQTLGIGSGADDTILDRVKEAAGRLGAPPSAVALAWLLSKPGVTSPIIDASKPHHLPDALAALELRLDAETLAALEAPYQPKPVAGHR